MNEDDRPTHRTVLASSLSMDDYITNLGEVVSTTEVGAFVVVDVATTTWELASGRPRAGHEYRVFHAADGVTIDLP